MNMFRKISITLPSILILIRLNGDNRICGLMQINLRMFDIIVYVYVCILKMCHFSYRIRQLFENDF